MRLTDCNSSSKRLTPDLQFQFVKRPVVFSFMLSSRPVCVCSSFPRWRSRWQRCEELEGGSLYPFLAAQGVLKTSYVGAQDIQRMEQLTYRVPGVSGVLTLAGKVGEDPVHAFGRVR